ncbi:hypothetical protein ACPCG0_03885 [Propionibacteriaceae bacterium Y1923]|uniref:hypothetical protein n=1 Tax=Aestuariimicrobium sp. Y1814 TaxID=3418742 RepID=UPI003C172F68
MYCARCGADVGARAIVCLGCGADLTRAGALRMTAGGLYEHAADLGLPDHLVARLDEDDAARRRAEAMAGSLRRDHAEEAELETRLVPKVQSTPSDPTDGQQIVAAPAHNPEASTQRQTIIATVLVTLLVIAALALVTFLASQLMDPLDPVGPPPTVASTPATPSSTPS